MPDNLCHAPDWAGDLEGMALGELDFGEQPRIVKIKQQQYEALIEYGD